MSRKCLCDTADTYKLRYMQHFIVNIVITGDLPAVVAVKGNDFREIVIYGVKFKALLPAPVHSVCQGVPGTAGPQDHLCR